MATIFSPSPTQSAGLQAAAPFQVPAPAQILTEELTNIDLMTSRTKDAGFYVSYVKLAEQHLEAVTRADVDEAKRYLFDCRVGASVPRIAAAVPLIQSNNVLDKLNDLAQLMTTNHSASIAQINANHATAQANHDVAMAQIHANHTRLSAKFSNANIGSIDDPITPLGGLNAHVPPGYPATLRGLRDLVAGPVLIAIENHHGLSHIGSTAERKKLLAYDLGVKHGSLRSLDEALFE